MSPVYRNLSTYLERLTSEGELVRVTAPVDPVLEIAEITDRVSKGGAVDGFSGGPALLFENVEGSRFPVVTNLFGSERRIAMALGADSLDEISSRLDTLLAEAFRPRGSFAQKAEALPLLARVARWFPRQTSGRGECQQVVLRGSEACLSLLPILKCWPYDGGRFVTLPLVHTLDPETGVRNVGMYRLQVFDERTTGMHWHMHKTGARHYEAHKRVGMARMPVSVCLGGDPVYTYAATAPLPDGIDEYILAGLLRQKPVKLVKCLTNDIYVPADCDFVIEGYIDTTEPLRTEGPFGDHTGFYSLEDPYPVFHVEAITHRRDAVYPATIVGIPPQEDSWFAAATERIFLPPIRRALQPEIRDLHMPPAGCAHNLAIVAVETAYAGQTEKVASALWGAGQMAFNKVLIATPADFPIRDTAALLELLRGIDPVRDLRFGHGILDVLDHATPTPGLGSKLLVDATNNQLQITNYEPTPSREPSSLLEWQRREGGGQSQLRTLFDERADDLTPYEKLWLGLANLDPTRDIKIESDKVAVDCRSKNLKRWPNVTVMDPATVAKVDRRWEEYGLGERIASPSDRYRKLVLSDGAEAK